MLPFPWKKTHKRCCKNIQHAFNYKQAIMVTNNKGPQSTSNPRLARWLFPSENVKIYFAPLASFVATRLLPTPFAFPASTEQRVRQESSSRGFCLAAAYKGFMNLRISSKHQAAARETLALLFTHCRNYPAVCTDRQDSAHPDRYATNRIIWTVK